MVAGVGCRVLKKQGFNTEGMNFGGGFGGRTL